jgi:uncharacterized membrane protein YczE
MDVSTGLWTRVLKATCRLRQAVRLFRFVVVVTFVVSLTPTSSLLPTARKFLVQDVSVWLSCFQQTSATSYNITGHTDARASDEYTMKLSYNRASSVARITQSSGARIADVRGYFERMPAVATNQTKQLTAALTKNTVANWLRVFGSIQTAVIIGPLITPWRAIFLNVSTNTVTCIFRGCTTEHGN